MESSQIQLEQVYEHPPRKLFQVGDDYDVESWTLLLLSHQLGEFRTWRNVSTSEFRTS